MLIEEIIFLSIKTFFYNWKENVPVLREIVVNDVFVSYGIVRYRSLF